MMTEPDAPPPPDALPREVAARISGVEDGAIGTQFTVDASASTGAEGEVLVFVFSVSGACSLVSQNGAIAVIRRHLVGGDCNVTVGVTDGISDDTANAVAAVTGGPPLPP